jgi:TolB protein
MQDVATGSRELISSGKGINGAPSFSPDGRKMAMALSHSGNLEIHVRDMATGRLTQLTQHWAIDTEPVWAPDGKYIYFTSDRGGKPQIYRVPPTGGNPERVTLEGDYNARASIAPDGRRIAVAHGRGNEYRIAVWDIETERFTVLTPGVLDESPSFAPNGSMVLYATREGTRGVLSAVSADGNVRQRLILSEGDVREPAWSPVIR